MARRVSKEVMTRLREIYARANGDLRRLAAERRAIVEAAMKAKAAKQIEEIRRRIASV